MTLCFDLRKMWPMIYLLLIEATLGQPQTKQGTKSCMISTRGTKGSTSSAPCTNTGTLSPRSRTAMRRTHVCTENVQEQALICPYLCELPSSR